MFNELVPSTDSYHEAVAVVVTRKHTDLDVHVDHENDWRPGHNTMHALSFTGNDAKGVFRLAFFGYPRRCIGNYMENLDSMSVDEINSMADRIAKRNDRAFADALRAQYCQE